MQSCVRRIPYDPEHAISAEEMLWFETTGEIGFCG